MTRRPNNPSNPESRVPMSHFRTTHRKDYEPHTDLAALKALRRKHPALIHVLGTCLSVTSLLAAVITAHTTRGR
ncbi:hypothetical protein ACFVT5_04370 [Streptomyces sp. NPDC058001]|uniref:hypothetical protein n=1 Tax=Streptomyces sp. NPDC058001 TaxID=3346300 RepID=UPI0036EF4712